MTLFIILMSVFAIVPISAGEGVLQPTLGNYPDVSLPLSADAAVAPNAAPTSTTGINVSSSTNFKGRLEGNPATGVVRVTNAHPAGDYIVAVQAFDCGTIVTKTFVLTVKAPATCNPVNFAAANNDSFSGPRALAVADFNGDGKQDFAVATIAGELVVFLGNGAGVFGSPGYFSVGVYSSSLVVGDFNGDGKQDLAVANNGTGNGDSSVSILLGNGAGGFGTASNLPFANSTPFSLAIGDFNNDGKQDLAVTNPNALNVSILFGDGAGHFSTPTNVPVSPDGNVAVGDFNRDGKQDLAVIASQRVAILLGNGAGGFSGPTYFGSGLSARALTVGDLNNDGKQDLAVTDDFNSKVAILMGDGAGLFSAPISFSVPITPGAVVMGDFNGDGNQDLAVLGARVLILLGSGTGSFGTATGFPVGSNPIDLAVGDFNGDGKQDIVTANFNQGDVTILLRDCALTPAPATLSNISTRLAVGNGDNVLIGGLIVTGTQSKRVIVRAIGQSLPVPGALADPILELHESDGTVVTNDNWRDTREAEIIATALAPPSNSDSAILAILPPGGHTAIVRGKNNTTGIALVEAYDIDRVADPRLANISTRGFVQSGDNVMIGGTIITGSARLDLLVRALGPSLSLPPANVPNALQDPALELYDGNGALIASNDNWRIDQQAAIEATGLAPADDRESAILRSLPSGGYTAIVRGSGASVGVALIEAYRLDH